MNLFTAWLEKRKAAKLAANRAAEKEIIQNFTEQLPVLEDTVIFEFLDAVMLDSNAAMATNDIEMVVMTYDVLDKIQYELKFRNLVEKTAFGMDSLICQPHTTEWRKNVCDIRNTVLEHTRGKELNGKIRIMAEYVIKTLTTALFTGQGEAS